MANTLTEELTALGFADRLDEFKKFVEYGGNETSRSYWGCGNGSCHILQVREFSGILVVLTEDHHWDRGTGIGMSTQVFVLEGEKCYVGKDDNFRDKHSASRDRMHRYFREIISVERKEGFFEITLRNPDGGYTDLIRVSTSKENR